MKRKSRGAIPTDWLYRSLVCRFSSASSGRPSTVHWELFIRSCRYYCEPGINHCRCYYWASTFTVYLWKGGCREPRVDRHVGMWSGIGGRKKREITGKREKSVYKGGWLDRRAKVDDDPVDELSRDDYSRECIVKKGGSNPRARARAWDEN